jgi:spoIIIJ-associated protein
MQEFHGASVQEATEKAAAKLGVRVEDLDYEVLDEGSAGFLGIGARDARIRVSENSYVTTEPETATPVVAEKEQDEREVADEASQDVLDEDPVTHQEPDFPHPAAETDYVEAPEEALLGIDRFLTGLLEAMGLNATVDVFDTGEVVVADVSTPQAGLFIGQKGETIDAVQHVTGVLASRYPGLKKRVVVDSEGYRQRRQEALQGMAHRAARRAAREHRSVELPPMAAAERRIIHLYLSENPSVSTFSEGEEGSRHVVVTPA